MKKALIIGINYIGSSNELYGCINDAVNIKNFIKDYGFNDVVLMTEISEDPSKIPYQSNIIYQMKKLISEAQIGDSLFIHYSGHGASIIDKSGDEDDGKDETIVPLDLKLIIDDDLRKILVDPLPKGVKLTCIFDCCHSGTGLDLKYSYITGGGFSREDKKEEYGIKIDKHYKDSQGDVILFSGCKDNQYSADTVFNNQAQGAMTFAFISTIKKLRNKNKLTYVSIIKNLQKFLKQNGYQQIPQLSSGKFLNLLDTFEI